jgi:hypothetical protein
MTKRGVAPPDEMYPTLPLDMWLQIVRVDHWLSSGRLARCSTTLLKAMTQPHIVWEILEIANQKRSALPRWLNFALPATLLHPPLLSPESSPRAKEQFEALLKTTTGYLTQGWMTRDLLFTGDTLCQILYGVKWEAETRVLYNARSYIRFTEDLSHHMHAQFVFVCKILDNMVRLIEESELSILQQGFLAGVYYLTPLALYTQHSKVIVAMPRGYVIKTLYFAEETGVRSVKGESVDLCDWVALHGTQLASDDSLRAISTEQPYRWIRYVNRYCGYFPDFALTHCRR